MWFKKLFDENFYIRDWRSQNVNAKEKLNQTEYDKNIERLMYLFNAKDDEQCFLYV